MRLSLLALALFTAPLVAQDAAQIANQQILLMNQQIAQAQQASQQASEQATQQMLQNQQLNQQVLNNQTGLGGCISGARTPSVLQEPGPTPGTVLIRMKSRNRGATIFYSVDGWTPTTNSTRYTGPFVLEQTTTIRAIAVVPGLLRSRVERVPVTIVRSNASLTPAPLPPVSDLKEGAAIGLLFTAPVIAHGLEIGDPLPVALAEDLLAAGKVVAPRLTPVMANVVQVDERSRRGLPASITFEVHAVTLMDGRILPLLGTKTIEGEPRTRASVAADTIPLGGLLIRGGEAAIPEGATLQARVAADTRTSTK